MSADPPLAEWILEQTTDAVVYADAQGTIARWNAAAALLFGFSAAEAIGRNLDLIIPEHLRAAHWKGFEAALAAGRTRLGGRPTVTRALHQSGSRLYVEMTFALVKDAAGQVIGSVAMRRNAWSASAPPGPQPQAAEGSAMPAPRPAAGRTRCGSGPLYRRRWANCIGSQREGRSMNASDIVGSPVVSVGPQTYVGADRRRHLTALS